MTKNQRPNWPLLITEFKQTGLSQSAYCKQKDLKLSTFNEHLRRHSSKVNPGAFVQVEVASPTVKTPTQKNDDGITLEIGLCKIYWPANLPMTSLASLVKQLS